MATTNPFWQVHNSIWTCLEASTAFTTLVADRRRIKDTEGDWVPDTLTTADGPSVRVVDMGDQTHIERTSNGSSIVMRFAIQVSTTSQKYESICDTRFAIIRAMTRWSTYVGAVTWSGTNPVRDFRFVESDTRDNNNELNRGNRSWATVLLCEVEMWFETEDLTE